MESAERGNGQFARRSAEDDEGGSGSACPCGGNMSNSRLSEASTSEAGFAGGSLYGEEFGSAEENNNISSGLEQRQSPSIAINSPVEQSLAAPTDKENRLKFGGPVPAPRPSKLKALQPRPSTYENVIVFDDGLGSATSIITPEGNSVEGLCHRDSASCEWDSSHNLWQSHLDVSERSFDDCEGEEDDELDSLPSMPPRSILDPRVTTIDIRNDVSKLFDQAVEELQRDTSLGEYLEYRREDVTNQHSGFKSLDPTKSPTSFDTSLEASRSEELIWHSAESSPSSSSAPSRRGSREERASPPATTPARSDSLPDSFARPASVGASRYESIWVPDDGTSDDEHADACESQGAASTVPPQPQPDYSTDEIAMAKICASKFQDISSDSISIDLSSNFKKVQKSASTSNISNIAKKFSFSKLGRRISDQMKRPSLKDSSGARPKSSMLRPTRGHSQSHSHSGSLAVFPKSTRGSVQERWVVLSHLSLRHYSQKESVAEAKEQINFCDILSLTKRHKRNVVLSDRATDASSDGKTASLVYCFDVGFLQSAKSKFCVRTFGSVTESTRDVWADKIVQSLCPRLMDFSMAGCMKLGWGYLKVMFAGEWDSAWVALTENELSYLFSDQESSTEYVDLKKIKNVTLVREIRNLNAPDNSPILVLDFVDRSLYLQTKHEVETSHWKEVIEKLAFSNQSSLDQQQLTKDEIPVFTERTINFVCRHGIMSEGIYRHSGVKTKIDHLLTEFRGNAWAVPLTREEFSEHDVANALKRFFRTLREPLLTERLRPQWIAASKMPSSKERNEQYKDLLSSLPDVNYRTLRRLIGHLRAIADQCSRNLMPNYNLAAIWGPTLLTVDGQDATDFAQTSCESDVCKDLIDNFMELFNVTQEEIDREAEIMKKTESFSRNPIPVKLSGEVMMFVYIDKKSSGECVSIAVTPKMTAHELSQKVLRKARFEGDTSRFVLHEVVLGGELERPIHHKELIYDVTLKWWQWSDSDRMDTYLLLKRSALLEEAVRGAQPPLSVFGEAMFGDNSRTRSSFKKCQLSMNNAKLTRSKEVKSGGSQVVDSWEIERLIWYFGCESKRLPIPWHSHNLTFIEKDASAERSKDRPFFGRTISFPNREFFIRFVAAMLVAEHQSDLLPPAVLLNIEED